MSEISNRGYAHPEVLVSTEWLADHLDDEDVRIVESNEDTLLYRSGHIPGAIEIDWGRDLNNQVTRDYISQDQFVELMGNSGISENSVVVLYGDKNNWWSCFAFWIFCLHGHKNLRIVDGGRRKWEAEGRPLTREVQLPKRCNYLVNSEHPPAIRAFRDEVLASLDKSVQLVDVRTPEEYRGERLHMPDYPNEGAVRGGHIPGAVSIPWAKAIDQNSGEFLDASALRALYIEQNKLNASTETIAYCRIGERSSHTWFVLKYLLGFTDVKNYDGSWTEWGNSVALPIAK